MRIGYALTVAAMLASAPAMAQVIVTSPGNDSAAHQAQADQDRAMAHQERNDARAEAAQGNYGNAARDQAQAHADWHAAHQQEHAADRDASGGVAVQIR